MHCPQCKLKLWLFACGSSLCVIIEKVQHPNRCWTFLRSLPGLDVIKGIPSQACFPGKSPQKKPAPAYGVSIPQSNQYTFDTTPFVLLLTLSTASHGSMPSGWPARLLLGHGRHNAPRVQCCRSRFRWLCLSYMSPRIASYHNLRQDKRFIKTCDNCSKM